MAPQTKDKKLTKRERKELKKKERLEKESSKKKQQEMKKYLNWGIGAAIIIGIVLFVRAAMTPTGPTGPVPGMVAIADDDWARGATKSATLLVKYSDFQCPACAAYDPIVERLLEEKGESFAFVYRHFPLAQHKNARLAAQAAEAAGIQGDFWGMHRLLFDRQDQWADEGNAKEIFIGYAQELGLETDKFAADLESEAVKAEVERDIASGNAGRVNSTPTFFVNGAKIDSPRSYDDFAVYLDTVIAEHEQADADSFSTVESSDDIIEQ